MPRYFFVFVFCLSSSFLFAQTIISGDFHNVPLPQVIDQLQKEHQLVFSYTEDLVSDQIISTSFQNQALEQGLALLFKPTAIAFEIVNEKYIILRLKQSATLRLCGTVMNKEGQLLPFANVFSQKTTSGTQTDENGSFTWESILDPSDTIVISYVGYLPQTFTTQQLMDCPKVQLAIPSFSFAEVVVKEYITAGIEQAEEFDHAVLHPTKINVVPGLTEADVLQMVQILPGVQSIDESATGLHIRGGTPDQNLILWDGVPIYNSGHFFGMISAFNPYIVDEVKVYRGGFGAEYGGRVSSVIDINSVEKIPDRDIAFPDPVPHGVPFPASLVDPDQGKTSGIFPLPQSEKISVPP